MGVFAESAHGESRPSHSCTTTPRPSSSRPLWRPRGVDRQLWLYCGALRRGLVSHLLWQAHAHALLASDPARRDLDLTDLLEPVLLPKPPEPDHLEPAPEEENTDTEVESTPEEPDDEVVTEKVKYNSPEPGPPIAGITNTSFIGSNTSFI